MIERRVQRPLRPLLTLSVALSLWPALALADGVGVNNDNIFPSNRYTVPDFGNATLRRVNLPKPDCATRPSDCADIDVINTLDGFSTQPRITVPFDGDIDPGTATSDNIYLVNLGDVLTLRGFGDKVGINQVVWDPASKTLAFESDELLQERSRYLLVVTNGVRDANGKKLKAANLLGGAHGRDLRDALPMARGGGRNVVAASLFTTQSTTGDLLKIQRRLKATAPGPVDFMLGNGGTVRTVFPVSGVAYIQFNRQTGTAPTFTPGFLPTPALQVFPGAVGQIAYGRYTSPEYQNAAKVIPTVPTLTGVPQPQGSRDLVFQLFMPATPRPAGGYPVAIFGHGFTDSMYGAPWTVASTLASQGIATLSINVVGHGGGEQGTLLVQPTAGAPVQLPAGGRGIDQDGNGAIDSTEGVNAAAPQAIVSSRDGLRQTVIDLMQLVRQVQGGIDVDGDGTRDLDPARIYYAGQSFGGIYGTIFLGVERDVRAGVPNVPGGSISEIARISPSFRILTGLALATRVPTLLNLPPTAQLPIPLNFNENIPLRNLPPVVNNVPGAMAIAELLDRNEWVQQAGNPVSYASLIRQSPPWGHAAKPIILQFAQGDVTVPNPTTTAIVRAGGFKDRVTRFRNDLAYAAIDGTPKNPHTFLTNIAAVPLVAQLAVGAQLQIATFFATDGTTVIDPDGGGPLFEVPIQGELPEGVNFIP
ncbi:MAG: Ig-like domain-containing protein [Hydrogenophaga sp.]|uniref:Ig-like domain-containing protein n=1 Tax=Hydrogenophaga sp. TaxID=1904254 RepID=UPI001D5EBE8E|nr:Ig-like domain-containing protein [Hydrogenophaga sp.]MBX3611923.1 Ig-like domain-containing protein [Hydrogenophaga sp.]